MAVLGPIVQPPAHLAAVLIAELLHRCRVVSEAVSDNLLSFAVPLQRLLQEGQSRKFVAFPGNEALENLPLVVDGPP